jgi:hypothetical protein
MPNRRRRVAGIRRPLRDQPDAPNDPDQHDRDNRKKGIRALVSSANKGLLAAIGTGVAGAITAVIVAAPHLFRDEFGTPVAQLTVSGKHSPDKGGEPCAVDGEYAVGPPASNHLPSALKIDALNSWLNSSGAADGGQTRYSFVLQGAAGKTVFVTGIHTVIDRRAPASGNEIPIYVDSNRCGAGPPQYSAAIDLDQRNPVPDISERNDTTGAWAPVQSFKYLATNGNPAFIDVLAVTRGSDVTWHLRIDYSVDGKADNLVIPGQGSSFHTIAPLGATKYTYIDESNIPVYSLKPGCPSCH